MRMVKILVLALIMSSFLTAVEVPGGLIRTADTLPNNTYELLLAPSYTFKPSGAYMNSEIRYQPNEDFGVGLGFGAGEAGFNFGVNGSWYLIPDLKTQPAVSILGGVYFNRLETLNYFNVKVAPVVSKQFKVDFGKVTPYAGIHLTPSFRLNEPSNEFSLKTSLGSQFEIQGMNGLRLFTEVDLGLVNSVHEILFGISYPFIAL